MAIVFGGDAGVRQDTFGSFVDKITTEFQRVKTGLENSFGGETSGLPPTPPKEKIFVDDGFTNVPGTSFAGSQIEGIDDIKTRRITTQEPQMTVYIKKRAFWSLRNENDTRFMDPGEKLFLRASKILFENKCSQIAAYEGLTKLSRLVSEDAQLDAERISVIIDALGGLSDSLEQDALTGLQTDPTNIELNNQLIAQVENIKADAAALIEGLSKLSRDQNKLKQSTGTTWVVDSDNAADVINIGRGSGVIELTLVTNLNTELSLEVGNTGSVQFSIEDPYNLTKITSDNIEIALGAAFQEAQDISISSESGVNNSDILASSGFNVGPQQLLEAAKDKDNALNRIRRNRINNTFGLSGSGTILSSSDAVELVFEINASSFAKNKVIGSVATLPEPFTKDNFRIILLHLPVEYQLTLEEDQLVTEIFDLLDRYVAEIERLNTANLENNDKSEVKYARRQLRSHYLGKSIVQPMDGIHVYMRSNTFKDGELTGPLGTLLNGTDFIRSFSEDDDVNDVMLEEEMKQFGLSDLNVPVSLYKLMRTGSFMRNAGTHVFGGLISTVTESYQADHGYVLNVSGNSNLKWLTMSRVNKSPALDQPNGILEDPLTAYDFNSAIDPGTGLTRTKPELLDENKRLIEAGFLTFVTGDNAGKKVESVDDLERDYFPFGDSVLPVGTHAPGLIYRWKEGVISVTRNINLRTALDGTGLRSSTLKQEAGITIVPDPFANLDAADIVSLLVTGYPHNYESFIINSTHVGSYIYGSQSNNPQSYFHYFFDVARRTNRALGNFQPFKTINISQDQLAKRINLQTDLKNQADKLADLRSQQAKLQDQLNSMNSPPEQIKQSGSDASRRNIAIISLSKDISDLNLQIDQISQSFMGKIKDGQQSGLRIYGNDIALNFERSTTSSTQEEIRENDKRNRLKNELLQLRTQLKCKFNNDTNLFIVSDDYDKDLDIQAFIIESLASQEPSLWENTQFQTPYDICTNVAKTLDFEFFSDTQGNVQFRAPKYNKVPLSLILRLFLLDKTQNKKLYPVFLQQMFKDRMSSYKDEADTVEIEIQIRNVLLNKMSIVSSDQANSTKGDETTTSVVISPLIGISTQVPTESQIRNRAELLVNLRNTLAAKIGGAPISTSSEQDVENAQKEIADLNNPSSPNINVKRLEIVNQLARLEGRKQELVSTISKITSQVDKFETSVGGLPPKGSRLTRQQMTQILTPFIDLVEDDFNDFLGPGSSKRFVIYDEQLINSTFTESDNGVVCRVDVNGQQDYLGEGPGIQGGIPNIWAGATDFDLWRQYGWRSDGPVTKPFFKDSELQCAPYALMLLNRARKNTVTGQITVVGNEYYQLGDVVYVNSRDMLYYVNRVSHSFDYNSNSFATTLDLCYGHPLGEYIATPLDVIGKNLIKTQRNFNLRTTKRQTATSNKGTSLGVVLFNSANSDNAFKEMLSGDIGKYNLMELKRISLIASSHIVTGQEFPKLDIRGFIIEDESNKDAAVAQSSKDVILAQIAAVRKWLMDPAETATSPLKSKDFPGFNPKSIRSVDEKLDPINIINIQEGNATKGRVPREEVFNVLTGRDFSNIVEVVLINND
jgi:hypothetical protein